MGEIPEHWDIKRLRRTISMPLSNGIFKKKEDFGSGALLVNVFDIYRDDFKVDFDSLERVQCNDSELLTYEVFPEDLFFVRSSLKKEGIAVVAMTESCSEAVVFECHLIRARPNRKILSGRFASYVLNSTIYRSMMIEKAKITTMTTIDQEAILSTHLPIPPINEQIQIEVFLDRETTKINELSKAFEGLIETLKEKRQAVISHAVTKGLDLSVPMKDSGIEWLGQVPIHWTTKKVKHVASMCSGSGITGEDIEEFGTYPVYGGNGLRGYTESMTHSGEHILIGRQGALCGNVHYVEGAFWASEHAVVCTFSKIDLPKYWLYLFELMNLGQYSVAAAQPGLAVDRIQQLNIASPPLDEQEQISLHLDKEVVKINSLILEAGVAIELLQERRTALISAAVTGKIDVRGLVNINKEEEIKEAA